VPFAVIPNPPSTVIGSVLLIHSVVSKSNTVTLAVSNLPQVPNIVVIKTITDSGESVSTQPYSSKISLTLPGTSVTEVTFTSSGFSPADRGTVGTGARTARAAGGLAER
jgi:hypothetical protein